MTVKTVRLALRTRGHGDVHEVTGQVARAVHESGLKDGIITLFTPSSTSAFTTLEFESGCVQDLQRLFEEIVPTGREYAHNARWGDGNGHSHIRAALLGASLTVPFVGGSLGLGTWQQIVFIDFDTQPRQREVIAQLIGE